MSKVLQDLLLGPEPVQKDPFIHVEQVVGLRPYFAFCQPHPSPTYKYFGLVVVSTYVSTLKFKSIQNYV